MCGSDLNRLSLQPREPKMDRAFQLHRLCRGNLPQLPARRIISTRQCPAAASSCRMSRGNSSNVKQRRHSVLVAAVFCEYLQAALFSGSDCRPTGTCGDESRSQWRRLPLWDARSHGSHHGVASTQGSSTRSTVSSSQARRIRSNIMPWNHDSSCFMETRIASR